MSSTNIWQWNILYLSFTFKGRIKSLIRAEGKFNGYIVEYIYDYYKKHKSYPDIAELKEKLNCFRDLIAYRIVISMPRCHLKNHENREVEELKHLYQIAKCAAAVLRGAWIYGRADRRCFKKQFPTFWRRLQNHITGIISPAKMRTITNPYILLFMITVRDVMWKCSFVQSRWMTSQKSVPPIILIMRKAGSIQSTPGYHPGGECIYFDEAYERCQRLQELELSGVDVDMFTAVSNSLMNDGCGLYRGRLILPYEHLSRFQNDLID